MRRSSFVQQNSLDRRTPDSSMNPVTFIHITDTHIGPTADYSRHGFASEPALVRMTRAIESFPVRPDFVVHTGDIVTDPDPRSYERAARLLADLSVPIYFVNGNHDAAHYVHEYLTTGPRIDWQSDPGRLAYEFEVRGERFVVLDGRGPDEIDPHGILPAEQLERVREICRTPGPPITFFIHFPLFPLNSPWFDRNMLLLNGEELHAAFLPASGRIRGVFFGHVHQSMQMTRDGITYTSAPSTFAQFRVLPVREESLDNPSYPPGFNLVQCMPGYTIVQQHVVPRS